MAPSARAYAALRSFARERPAVERCEMCAVPLAEPHDHLLERTPRTLVCACTACVTLVGTTAAGRWTRVPHRIVRLDDVHLDERTWQRLEVPVDLAFFVRRDPDDAVVAVYPSAAGPVEARVPPRAWTELVDRVPAARALAPDVEALLVSRRPPRAEHYVVSVDEGYRLVGLIRRHWRGIAGGADVEARIAEFFAELARGSAR